MIEVNVTPGIIKAAERCMTGKTTKAFGCLIEKAVARRFHVKTQLVGWGYTDGSIFTDEDQNFEKRSFEVSKRDQEKVREAVHKNDSGRFDEIRPFKFTMKEVNA